MMEEVVQKPKWGSLPRRQTVLILASLVGVTVLAWIYLIYMATSMSGDQMPMMIREWNASYFLMMLLMWAIMMVGMMVPSVMPATLIYASIARKAKNQDTPIASTGAFVAGYLAVWTFFSLLATVLQFGLDKAALLSPMLVSNSVWLGSALLILAGVYQLLPVKNGCLEKCRSPLAFFTQAFQSGTQNGIRIGVKYGIFCLGCCWVLMLLLFVGGVMNLLWIAIITSFVLFEKLLPFGDRGGRIFGILMILAGLGFVLVYW